MSSFLYAAFVSHKYALPTNPQRLSQHLLHRQPVPAVNSPSARLLSSEPCHRLLPAPGFPMHLVFRLAARCKIEQEEDMRKPSGEVNALQKTETTPSVRPPDPDARSSASVGISIPRSLGFQAASVPLFPAFPISSKLNPAPPRSNRSSWLH